MNITSIVLLGITILLVLAIGFLLLIVAHNRESINNTRKFFRRHGIDDKSSFK